MPNTTMGKFGRITTLKQNDGQGGALGGLVVVIQELQGSGVGWGDVPAEKSEANAAGSWTPDALTGDAFSGICVVPFCKQMNKQERTMKGLGTSQETLSFLDNLQRITIYFVLQRADANKHNISVTGLTTRANTYLTSHFHWSAFVIMAM